MSNNPQTCSGVSKITGISFQFAWRPRNGVRGCMIIFRTMMKRTFGIIIGLLVVGFWSCTPHKESQATIPLDSVITYENDQFVLGIDLIGGAYRDFYLKGKPLNPFGWTLLESQMPENNRPFTFDGHFLCTGRWGAPSEGEIKAGIPHNGEVNTQLWQVRNQRQENGMQIIDMSVKAPIEKLDVRREIFIPEDGHYFLVKEWFTNNLPIGRISNVVQHGTIASPFLSESTIINTNATHGFDQRTNYKYLEDSSFLWPSGKMADGSAIDLSRVGSDMGFVTSHIFEDSIGWITAFNPEQNLLMGYVWKTNEYPWLNVWHMSKEGRPFVQGLEFGTTGLGQPYKLLTENNVTFFGRNSFEYIDAGESMEKSWICFMIEVPAGADVSEINYNGKAISIVLGSGEITFQVHEF